MLSLKLVLGVAAILLWSLRSDGGMSASLLFACFGVLACLVVAGAVLLTIGRRVNDTLDDLY